jgi:hypothetical protein
MQHPPSHSHFVIVLIFNHLGAVTALIVDDHTHPTFPTGQHGASGIVHHNPTQSPELEQTPDPYVAIKRKLNAPSF